MNIFNLYLFSTENMNTNSEKKIRSRKELLHTLNRLLRVNTTNKVPFICPLTLSTKFYI